MVCSTSHGDCGGSTGSVVAGVGVTSDSSHFDGQARARRSNLPSKGPKAAPTGINSVGNRRNGYDNRLLYNQRPNSWISRALVVKYAGLTDRTHRRPKRTYKIQLCADWCMHHTKQRVSRC